MTDLRKNIPESRKKTERNKREKIEKKIQN